MTAIKYKHTTYEEAKKNGIKVKGVIHGKEYTGYEYEGYFYHYVEDVGNCKILSKWCDNVSKPILYALHPGWIESINDGTRHYIDPDKLVILYKVNRKKCILWKNDNRATYTGRKWEDYIHLFPQAKYEDYNLERINHG